jgi:peptidoglycan/xylan/chitin deacetylase (PgdA/CDA1 family)
MSLRARGRQLLIHATTSLGVDAANRMHERGAMQARDQALVRVLYFHATRPAFAAQFRRQLTWLHQHFDIIDFAGLKQRFESAERPQTDRPAVLLTFDDGFVSNHDVAAPLLEEFGMRGVFFVAPTFTLAGDESSRAFFATQLHGKPERYERAMTPDEIGALAERGHTIGNHTFSHARLSATPEADYHHEIVDAAALIESWTGRPVETFAWPYAWNAITPAAHRLAAERHAYCFSPCAGVVDPRSDSPSLLWRTNAEADRSFGEFRFQCSGLADYANASRRQWVRRTLEIPAAPTDFVPPHHAALALRNSRARS